MLKQKISQAMKNSIESEKIKKFVKKIILISIVFLNIGCDQISKNIVRDKVIPNDYIHLLSDNFILTNVENTGAMLGFGQDLPPILKIIFLQVLPIVILLVMLFSILKNGKINKWQALAFAFVIGGGIGNLIDRILYNSVTDFFHIRIGFLKTGIFNMADVSVTLGAIAILILNIKLKKLEI